MSDSIYQHYRAEESVFIDAVYGWIQQVHNNFIPYLTVFLTPRERHIIRQITANIPDANVDFFGGIEEAERSRALIYPEYFEPNQADYEVSLIEIKYPQKFGELTHSQILGTLLSTGIDRDRIGDIITDGKRWQFSCDVHMVDYLSQQINKVGRIGVQLKKIELDEVIQPLETWETETIIASSLRLDTLISNVYNFSRQRAKNAISAGLVTVNFKVADRPDITIEVEDLVSMRRQGRFWIHSIDGTTRKDNYRLTVNVLNR